MTELKKWLRSENLFQRTKETQVPSHLLYDGGKIFVPRDREHEFLYHYAEAMEAGEKLYYVETRPSTFKFMIDVDITDDHYWTDEEIIKLTKFIQGIVFDFYNKNQMTICAISPSKEKKDGTHTGVHLIWPKLVVISETARVIRRGIVQKLNEEYGSCPRGPGGPKTWEDVIDEVIYTRNGYRMVGSDKMTPPPNKQPENRELVVKFVMNSNGDLKQNYLERLQNDYKALALETSIRYVLDTHRRKGSKGMEIKTLPKWLEEDALEFAENNGKKSKIGGSLVGSREHLIIEHFIKHNLPKQYNRGTVKAVTRYPDGNLLIKTTSRYCMNLGRAHNSCGIYFFATPNGLYQKCLCPCDKLKGRKCGYCRDYTSDCYPFSQETTDLLFPEQAKSMFKESKKGKNGYQPRSESKKTKNLEKKALCDKLLDDILG